MKIKSVVTIVAVAALSTLSGCMARRLMHQQHQNQQPLEVPETTASLRVPEGRVLMLELKAKGAQIYECGLDRADSTKFTWNFKAPDAELFDTHGKRSEKQVAKHYGGPTWEGNDGSKVIGEVVASENSPDANAVSWLLLRATSNSGEGIFAKTKNIQRLDTSGGKAPTDVCDRAHLGIQAKVPYSARYYFYD